MDGSGKTYSLNIVGESNYQEVIAYAEVGQPVTLTHEPTNRHDKRAIAATIAGGQTIGYVPRDSFLQRVIIEEGKDVSATILRLTGGTRSKPHRGVVLSVTIY